MSETPELFRERIGEVGWEGHRKHHKNDEFFDWPLIPEPTADNVLAIALAVYTQALRDVVGQVIDQASRDRIHAYAASLGIDLDGREGEQG